MRANHRRCAATSRICVWGLLGALSVSLAASGCAGSKEKGGAVAFTMPTLPTIKWPSFSLSDNETDKTEKNSDKDASSLAQEQRALKTEAEALKAAAAAKAAPSRSTTSPAGTDKLTQQPAPTAPQPGSQTAPGNYDQELARARSLEQVGRQAEAGGIYGQLVRSHPRRYEAYYRLGVLADREGKHAAAEGLYAQAVQLNANDSHVWNDLSYCCYMQGKLDRAEQAMLKAVALTPADPQYHQNLGMIYGHQGRQREALEQFRLAGNEADACSNLGVILASHNDLQGAQTYLRQALQLNPAHTAARKALDSLAPAAATTAPTPPASSLGAQTPPAATAQIAIHADRNAAGPAASATASATPSQPPISVAARPSPIGDTVKPADTPAPASATTPSATAPSAAAPAAEPSQPPATSGAATQPATTNSGGSTTPAATTLPSVSTQPPATQTSGTQAAPTQTPAAQTPAVQAPVAQAPAVQAGTASHASVAGGIVPTATATNAFVVKGAVSNETVGRPAPESVPFQKVVAPDDSASEGRPSTQAMLDRARAELNAQSGS